MANVSLLRAVYHVLKHRDAQSSSSNKCLFKRWDDGLRASRPEPQIYWDFIVSERNLLLKEYRSAAGQGVTVSPPFVELNSKIGATRVIDPGFVEHNYLMNDGPFKGVDQRTLIGEAIRWWEQQIASLESAGAA